MFFLAESKFWTCFEHYLSLRRLNSIRRTYATVLTVSLSLITKSIIERKKKDCAARVLVCSQSKSYTKPQGRLVVIIKDVELTVTRILQIELGLSYSFWVENRQTISYRGYIDFQQKFSLISKTGSFWKKMFILRPSILGTRPLGYTNVIYYNKGVLLFFYLMISIFIRPDVGLQVTSS